MSIDLTVIPKIDRNVTWYRLKEQWFECLTPDQRTYVGDECHLINLRNKQILDIHETIAVETYYYINTSNPCTLRMYLHTNSTTISGTEEELLLDYPTALQVEVVKDYAETWKATGYDWVVTSFGGRSKPESRLMIALVKTIARMLEGLITVEQSNIFSNLTWGLYSIDQFKDAKPLF